jgi:hypothetical protein
MSSAALLATGASNGLLCGLELLLELLSSWLADVPGRVSCENRERIRV